jgi:hypothetical protein
MYKGGRGLPRDPSPRERAANGCSTPHHGEALSPGGADCGEVILRIDQIPRRAGALVPRAHGTDDRARVADQQPAALVRQFGVRMLAQVSQHLTRDPHDRRRSGRLLHPATHDLGPT